MGVIWKMILALSLSLMVGGDGEPVRAPEVAQMVTVQVRDGNEVWEKRFTEPGKMEVFLLYLRNLRPEIPAQTDPERYVGVRYRISVYLSSGRKNVYYQHSNRFLSRNGKPWLVLEPEKGRLLDPLVKAIPEDGN